MIITVIVSEHIKVRSMSAAVHKIVIPAVAFDVTQIQKNMDRNPGFADSPSDESASLQSRCSLNTALLDTNNRIG